MKHKLEVVFCKGTTNLSKIISKVSKVICHEEQTGKETQSNPPPKKTS